MLKSRNHLPPGGFRFRQAETDWSAPRHLSFDDTVTAIIKHRLNNPQHKLATDRAQVEHELELYTIARLKQRPGGDAYIVGDTGSLVLPKSLPLRERPLAAGAVKFVKNTVAGASLWAKWFADGPVTRDVAERRAAVCIACPAHIRGSLMQRFTQVVARELGAVFGALKEAKMETAYDESLAICDICDCPMRAKVWVPLPLIESELRDETKAALPANCWIKHKL